MKQNKSSKRIATPRFRPSQFIPIWNAQHTDAVTQITLALFNRLEISDLSSYFEKLIYLIWICSISGALAGGYFYGFWGSLSGLGIGMTAPALLIWLAVIVSYSALLMAVFLASGALIFNAVLWIFGR